VLTGDGQLGIVEAGELSGREASFPLDLEVAEARPDIEAQRDNAATTDAEDTPAESGATSRH
jgi:hypothetical protein